MTDVKDDSGYFGLATVKVEGAPFQVEGGSPPADYLWHGPPPETSSLESLIAELRECAEKDLWFEIPSRDAKVLLAALTDKR